MRAIRPALAFAILAPLALAPPRAAHAQAAAPQTADAQPALAISPPRPVGGPVVADFPSDPRAQGRGARVVLEITVDAQGHASDARTVTPPQPGFDEAALAAAARLRFEPARRGGQAIPVRIQYAFNFEPPPPAASAGSPGPGAKAGPVLLAGEVRERGTRRRLAGLEVTVDDAAASAVTDAQGRFSFPGLAPGDHTVSVAAVGYAPFSGREKIVAGERLELVIRLEPTSARPLVATVEATRDRREVSRTSVSLEEANRIPGTQGEALKIVEDLPGVARTSPIGGGFLVIRGSNPGDSLVFLDGLYIPLLFHFGALSSTVNSDLLGAVDYIPGNFSVEYGDMTGGLVQVRSRALRDDLHGYANLNLLETSLLLEGKVPGVTGLNFAIAGRRSYIDAILKAVVPSDGDLALTAAPRYYDGQLRLDYKVPGSGHSLGLLALTSNDLLGLLVRRPSDRDPNLSGDLDVETGFNQLRLRDSYRAGDFTLDTIGMFEHALFRFGVGNEKLRIQGNDLFFRSQAGYRASDALALTAGFDLSRFHASVSAQLRRSAVRREGDPEGAPRPDEADTVLPTTAYDRVVPALFAEARWKPVPNLTLTPGARLDAFFYTAQTRTPVTLSPRLTARWQVTPDVLLKGGAGLYSQGPRNGDASSAFGNPDLAPQRALQITAGAELRLRPDVLFTAEVFDKRLRDIPVNVPDGGPGHYLDNAGVGHITGLEVLLRKELSDRVFGWLAYTFSRSRRTDRPGRAERFFDFDQTHNLTAVGSYRFGSGWQLGGRLRLISGNPSTPIEGARYLASSDSYLPIYGPLASQRLPLFAQLDVRVDKIWTFDTWQLDLYLDVLNSTNRRSIEGVAYSYDYSQSEYFRGLPIIPTLGLKGSF